MAKQKKFLLFLLFILSLVGLFFLYSRLTSRKNREVTIRNHVFSVEIADTDDLRTKGLSGRKNLSPNTGMLFLFPLKGIYSFWMKDMLFPLDFIWISDDTVVDLTENVPPPLPSSAALPFYTPQKPVDKVLEVSAGAIDNFGIRVGETIILH